MLPPSQLPPQPLAVEPPTSSSRRPWVPNLQSPSLRSFTLHRPLLFASLLRILLRFHFWRYHWDRPAPIYTFVKSSPPSETARTPTRRSKILRRWSRTTRASTRCHALSRTGAWSANVIISATLALAASASTNLLTSSPRHLHVILWLHPLIVDHPLTID